MWSQLKPPPGVTLNFFAGFLIGLGSAGLAVAMLGDNLRAKILTSPKSPAWLRHWCTPSVDLVSAFSDRQIQERILCDKRLGSFRMNTLRFAEENCKNAEAGVLEPKYLKGAIEQWSRPVEFINIQGVPLVVYRFKQSVSIATQEDYKKAREFIRRTLVAGDRQLPGVQDAARELHHTLTSPQDNTFICHQLEQICRNNHVIVLDNYSKDYDRSKRGAEVSNLGICTR